ncbi:MAG TPA: hypothetical protein VJV79_06945 [Polyangiaceae bacterium]|nr:hypothetical protein [Polyangiaceae bacterium]
MSPRRKGQRGNSSALQKPDKNLSKDSQTCKCAPEAPRDSSGESANDVVPLGEDQGYDELIDFLVEEAVRAWKADNP